MNKNKNKKTKEPKSIKENTKVSPGRQFYRHFHNNNANIHFYHPLLAIYFLNEKPILLISNIVIAIYDEYNS